MDVVITRSKKKEKKFDAIIDGKKTVSFGAKGMSDMTIHKDPECKKRYVNRHKKTKTGQIQKRLGFMQNALSGTNHSFKRLSLILKRIFQN